MLVALSSVPLTVVGQTKISTYINSTAMSGTDIGVNNISDTTIEATIDCGINNGDCNITAVPLVLAQTLIALTIWTLTLAAVTSVALLVVALTLVVITLVALTY
jgi:hypothetical protein